MSQGELLPAISLRIFDFEFDDTNRDHLARHGIDDLLVWDVSTGGARLFQNRPGRAASHLMIGPDATGRLWTIALVQIDDELALWRPVTGWPSAGNKKEVEAWRAAE